MLELSDSGEFYRKIIGYEDEDGEWHLASKKFDDWVLWEIGYRQPIDEWRFIDEVRLLLPKKSSGAIRSSIGRLWDKRLLRRN